VSWFTPAELQRAEAYHEPLARAELAAAVAELALLVIAATTIGPTGDGAGAAARVGLVAASVGLVPRMVLGWWRELLHEPARGLVEQPEQRVGVPALVVLLDELAQFLARAMVWGVSVGLLAWWSACPPVVALLVVPGLVVVAVVLSGPVRQVWHARVDRLVEVPLEVLPQTLWTAVRALPGSVAVRWYRGGPATSRRGEDGYVFRRGSGAAVVLSPEVLDGPPALLEAVAAHELGHVRALRSGPVGATVRTVAVAVAVFGVGLALRRHLAGAVPGLWFVVGAVLAGDLAGAVLVERRRRAESAADRWAASVVADPSACATAVRLRLVQAGIDLAPRGLRRWRSAYPPASERLDVLVRGHGTDHLRPSGR